MKTITSFSRALSIFVLTLFVSQMQAQDTVLSISKSGALDLNYSSDNEVLFQQSPGGLFGLVSSYSSGLEAGVYGSDDFVLAEDSQITGVTVTGYQTEGNLEELLGGLKFYIYPDDENSTQPAGHPSDEEGNEIFGITLAADDPALSVTAAVNNGETVYTFSIDVSLLTELHLEADTRYWLVVAPVLDSEDIEDEDLHWNWYLSSNANSTDSMFIDPDDLGDMGITEWTTLSDLGVPFPQIGFAMIIEGIPNALSIQETIKASDINLFPNPTRDLVQLQYASPIVIKQVEIYNLLGKRMEFTYSNNIIDLSRFSSGIYIITIETNKGQLTKRLIKN